ncbi:MAG TPA: hypothetical protein VF637_03030 [Sphingomicrobium sp.]|jgi:hypothetical protein
MRHLKAWGAAALIAAAMGLGSAASAGPTSPAPAGVIAGEAAIETVALGCGPGFTRNRFGACRPILRPRFFGPRRFYGRPRFYGPRRFHGPRRFYR